MNSLHSEWDYAKFQGMTHATLTQAPKMGESVRTVSSLLLCRPEQQPKDLLKLNIQLSRG